MRWFFVFTSLSSFRLYDFLSFFFFRTLQGLCKFLRVRKIIDHFHGMSLKVIFTCAPPVILLSFRKTKLWFFSLLFCKSSFMGCVQHIIQPSVQTCTLPEAPAGCRAALGRRAALQLYTSPCSKLRSETGDRGLGESGHTEHPATRRRDPDDPD